MHELRRTLGHALAKADAGEPAALATVIRTSGSTYRRPGARMVVTPSETVGAVSAGCLEDEVVSTAHRVMESGRPETLHVDTTEEMDAVAGTGLGCRGTMEIFVEPVGGVRSVDAYRAARSALDARQPGVLALVVESELDGVEPGTAAFAPGRVFEAEVARERGLDPEEGRRALAGALTEAAVEDPEIEGWADLMLNDLALASPLAPMVPMDRGQVSFYVERIEPPPRLLVFGARFEAVPLVGMAARAGFSVIVLDHRPDSLAPERFPEAERLVRVHPNELDALVGAETPRRNLPETLLPDPSTSAVVMTHNHLYDLEILKRLLEWDLAYIGQIGPRDRTRALLEGIRQERGEIPEARLERLHAPVGLDIGAETPEEIAVSIVAELVAQRREGDGGFLRERAGPIHRVPE